MDNLLTEFINPQIVALTVAYTAGVLRIISKFYKQDLSNDAKMVISCVIGAFLAFVELQDVITFKTAINAILEGGISGFTATTGYSAIKNLKKREEEIVINNPV